MRGAVLKNNKKRAIYLCPRFEALIGTQGKHTVSACFHFVLFVIRGLMGTRFINFTPREN